MFSNNWKEKEEAAEAVDVHRREKEQLQKLAEKLRKGEDITSDERNKIADHLHEKPATKTTNKK